MRPPSFVSSQRLKLISRGADTQFADFAIEVSTGLTASPKRLPCRYFYDRNGSLLFEAICELAEYYLTRAEREILQQRAKEVASEFSGRATLVELGSGSATKTRILIEAFLSRQGGLRYVPVDISRAMLEESSLALLEDYPALQVIAIAGEYSDGLQELGAMSRDPKLILWMGSNIGNLERPDAAAFLRRVRDTMAPEDRLLVGIDLRKDRAVLERAYDDSRGVTAQFNLNILARINRELGGHFDLTAFRHTAVYDEEVGRIEMYLVSTRPQRVSIDRLELEVPFATDETVHTENSYKYSVAEIETLAAAAGLGVRQQWFDVDRRFGVNLLAPRP